MRLFLLILSAFFTLTLAQAEENSGKETPAEETITDYAQLPAAKAHVHTLAETQDFDEDYLISLLMAIHRDDSVLEKISRPAEKTKPWHEYRPIFLDQARIDNGVVFYQQNKDWLEKAYQDYGVDPAIIVAIIGVETRYGKVTGKTEVLSALATLCFDYPPRASFFCSEFDHFLILARRENWNPLSVQGSYAGAMGMAQFMPSSYLNDAIDFDGDGKVDLWGSPADAIGSIANYLRNRGWQRDGNLVFPIDEALTLEAFGETHQPTLSVTEIKQEKSLEDDKKLINWLGENPPEVLGSLVLQGTDGKRLWLTDNNFFVITRYNTSPMYAMAVTDLAVQISKHF